MPDQPLLQVSHLKKYFKTPAGVLHAVDDVSFSIRQGTTFGVVGESGCGKSTLGRTVIRLQDATEGTVLFDGQDITAVRGNKRLDFRRNMQMIFQDPFSSLNPRMSVFQTIAEPMVIYGEYRNRQDLSEKVARLMDTVGLARRYSDVYPHELDGGRRQRIGIARALSLNPRFIVCDEPVSALDVSIQAQILNLMQDLQEDRKLTYLFISHNMAVVRHISDVIMVMYLGKVVEMAPADELFAHPLHPYTKALLDSVPVPAFQAHHNRRILTGETTSPIDPKPGCRFATRCPYADEKCMQGDPPTQEVSPGHLVACARLHEIMA